MTLAQYVVFDAYYSGLRVNGWPKIAAADAARRHLRRMSDRQVRSEASALGGEPS
jgi:hypothetical protein